MSEPNEVVERVALAIVEVAYRRAGAGAFDGSITAADRDTARAAIAAMREPTEAMLDSGKDRVSGPLFTVGGVSERLAAGEAWRAMIDAALKE